MLQAEKTHRQHAVIEQVNADLKAGPLAHLPSGKFAANSAWLVLARSRSTSPAPPASWPRRSTPKATTATIRAQLIPVPARLARSAPRIRMHLPRDWSWESAWTELFISASGPPAAAA